MNLFLCELELADDSYYNSDKWSLAEAKTMVDHFNHLQMLHENKILKIAGKSKGKRQKNVLIVNATTVEEAENIAKETPAVKAGLMNSNISEFTLVFS